jgi:TonB family protein
MKLKHIVSLVAAFGLIACPLFGGTSDPELIEGSMPAYPEQARAAGVEGIVIVEALIDEQGNVFAADVVSSPDESLNAATLEAVAKWKFTPAMVDGKAIMKVVRIPVNFHLTDPVKESVLQSQNNAVAAR